MDSSEKKDENILDEDIENMILDQEIAPQDAKQEDNRNLKEKLYDKIPVSVETMDKVLYGIIALIIVAIIIGTLKGRGFL